MGNARADRDRTGARGRLTRRLAAGTLAVAAVVAAPMTQASASGGWQTVPPVGNYDGGVTNMSLSLAGTVRLTHHGLGARWDARLACPAGRPFTLDMHLDQLASPLVPPWVFGEDYGVPAAGSVDGVCKGRVQTVTVPMVVTPTKDGEAIGTPKLFPLLPKAGFVAHYGSVVGTGFSASWCRNPACASETPGLSALTLKK